MCPELVGGDAERSLGRYGRERAQFKVETGTPEYLSIAESHRETDEIGRNFGCPVTLPVLNGAGLRQYVKARSVRIVHAITQVRERGWCGIGRGEPMPHQEPAGRGRSGGFEGISAGLGVGRE